MARRYRARPLGAPWRPPIAGLAAIAVVFAAGSCSTGAEPLTPPSPVPNSVPGPAESGAPALYAATGLDLCGRTDLGVLSELMLSVDGTDPHQPSSGPGASCMFEMHTAAGQRARLLVEAATPASVEDAQSLYRAAGRVTTMASDGEIAGLGDQATGFAQESEPGFKYSEYMVVVRSRNLVLTVWLGVGGDTFTPKQTLAAKVLALAEATLVEIPRS